MDKKIGLVLGVLVLVSIGLTGCSSGDGGGASHGVSPSKTLNSLSQQEIDKICDSIERQMKSSAESAQSLMDNADFMCTMRAVGTALITQGTTADCESEKQDCLEQTQEMESETYSDDSSSDEDDSGINCVTTDDVSECEATVGDIDACFNTLFSEMSNAIKQAKSAMSKISCNNLDDENMSMEDMDIDEPEMEDVPECQALFDECPGLMDESSEMTYEGPYESSS